MPEPERPVEPAAPALTSGYLEVDWSTWRPIGTPAYDTPCQRCGHMFDSHSGHTVSVPHIGPEPSHCASCHDCPAFAPPAPVAPETLDEARCECGRIEDAYCSANHQIHDIHTPKHNASHHTPGDAGPCLVHHQFARPRALLTVEDAAQALWGMCRSGIGDNHNAVRAAFDSFEKAVRADEAAAVAARVRAETHDHTAMELEFRDVWQAAEREADKWATRARAAERGVEELRAAYADAQRDLELALKTSDPVLWNLTATRFTSIGRVGIAFAALRATPTPAAQQEEN